MNDQLTERRETAVTLACVDCSDFELSKSYLKQRESPAVYGGRESRRPAHTHVRTIF